MDGPDGPSHPSLIHRFRSTLKTSKRLRLERRCGSQSFPPSFGPIEYGPAGSDKETYMPPLVIAVVAGGLSVTGVSCLSPVSTSPTTGGGSCSPPRQPSQTIPSSGPSSASLPPSSARRHPARGC